MKKVVGPGFGYGLAQLIPVASGQMRKEDFFYWCGVILSVGGVSAHVLGVKGGCVPQPQGTKGHLTIEPFSLDNLGELDIQYLSPRFPQKRNFQFPNGLLVLPSP